MRSRKDGGGGDDLDGREGAAEGREAGAGAGAGAAPSPTRQTLCVQVISKVNFGTKTKLQ